MQLYGEYAPKNIPTRKRSAMEIGGGGSSSLDSGSGAGKSLISKWKLVSSAQEEEVISHEVDKYLSDSLEELIESQWHSFPILDWWKLNGRKYHVLAALAKDVLAIQVSTVSSNSAFSTGERVINHFRSSLTPKSTEAFICLQSWLRGSNISCKEYAPCIEDLEFYEKCEIAQPLQLTALLQVHQREDDDDDDEEEDDGDEDDEEEGDGDANEEEDGEASDFE